MTPNEFIALAEQIAGPRWRTALPKVIGKSRWMVWAYAGGRCEVPETVAKLMKLLAESEVV